MLMGYKRIPHHIIFDVKFDGRLKARLVAGGHRTPDVPKEESFSTVVSRKAVQLVFILAKMNNREVCAGDVGNTYLYSKRKEKVYIVAGPEFGPEIEVKRLITHKALYGLKTSAAWFHEHLSVKLRRMGFCPSKVDQDLWIQRTSSNGYEYIARFVDDVIAFADNPRQIMNEIKSIYVMKGVGKPEYYLGGDIITLSPEWEKEGITTAFSAKTYIKNCIPKLAKMCEKEQFKAYKTPFREDYHPELDTTPLCDSEKTSKYKSLVESANWCIMLGRFDIAYATSTLARYTMAPREGHFEAMERVFGYLSHHADCHIPIDIQEPSGQKEANMSYGFDWVEFYPDAVENIPDYMLPPKGKEAKLTGYLDADHARDKVTCRSVTGIIVLSNNTPILWLSKRQKTVETSTYGSEMVAARIAVGIIIEMRYKLRMLGIPIEKHSMLLGDNKLVVVNTTLPSSMLKKKYQACNYHQVREAIAAGFI